MILTPGDKHALVKKLREESGVGVMDCLSSLERNEWDYQRAKLFLTDHDCPRCGKKMSTFPGMVVMDAKELHCTHCGAKVSLLHGRG